MNIYYQKIMEIQKHLEVERIRALVIVQKFLLTLEASYLKGDISDSNNRRP